MQRIETNIKRLIPSKFHQFRPEFPGQAHKIEAWKNPEYLKNQRFIKQNKNKTKTKKEKKKKRKDKMKSHNKSGGPKRGHNQSQTKLINFSDSFREENE